MGCVLVLFCYKFSQTCNMDRAEALVREMEEEGIDAPIDIYHTMMDGYTIIGNEEKCLIVFNRLQVITQLIYFQLYDVLYNCDMQFEIVK